MYAMICSFYRIVIFHYGYVLLFRKKNGRGDDIGITGLHQIYLVLASWDISFLRSRRLIALDDDGLL